MSLNPFFASALVSGVVVLTGWGAVSFAGLTVGLTEAPSEPSSPRLVGDSPVATASISRLAPAQAAPAPQPALEPDQTLNGLLFNPQFVVPRAATKPSTTASAPSNPPAPATAVPPPPSPPVQPEAQQETKNEPAAKPKAASRTQRPPRDDFQGPFTQAHIARIKQRLRLTPDQEALWEPVEAALKRIAQKQKGKNAAALTATESQNLYWAAGPLIMSLRPDQKEEARNMARGMGLETVASLI